MKRKKKKTRHTAREMEANWERERERECVKWKKSVWICKGKFSEKSKKATDDSNWNRIQSRVSIKMKIERTKSNFNKFLEVWFGGKETDRDMSGEWMCMFAMQFVKKVEREKLFMWVDVGPTF